MKSTSTSTRIHPSLNNSDWMKNYHHRRLCDLWVIPGTHNSLCCRGSRASAARVGTSLAWPWCKTQTLSLMQQLLAGIRFLDVRIADGYKHDGDARVGSLSNSSSSNCVLVTHSFDSDACLVDVLRDVREFLTDHPTEAIFLHLRKDHNRTLVRRGLVRGQLNDSDLEFAPFHVRDGLCVELSDLAGKVSLVCDGELLGGTEFGGTMPPFWPTSVMRSVCDTWRCSTPVEARRRLRQYLRSPPSSETEAAYACSTRSGNFCFRGVALDATFSPLPPRMTSPAMNQWLLDGLRDDLFRPTTSVTKPLGLCILDFVTDEICSELLRFMEVRGSIDDAINLERSRGR